MHDYGISPPRMAVSPGRRTRIGGSVTFQRDYPRRLRVGIVGAGNHVYRTLMPLLSFLPVELAAVCDPRLDQAESTARLAGARAYPSAAEMYATEELDAVLIAVAARLHPGLCIEAL